MLVGCSYCLCFKCWLVAAIAYVLNVALLQLLLRFELFVGGSYCLGFKCYLVAAIA